MSAELTDRHKLPGTCGSFWTSSLAPEQAGLVRALVRMSETNLADEFRYQQEKLLGATDGRRGAATLQFHETDIRLFGADLQRRVFARYGDSYFLRAFDDGRISGHGALATEFGDAIATEDGGVIVFPMPGSTGFNPDLKTFQTRWLLPIKSIPLILKGKKGDLLAVVDFICKGDFIQFFQDPRELFELPYVVASITTEKVTNLFSYTLKSDVLNFKAEEIVRYRRTSQTAKQFERAIACAAGLSTTPGDGVLLKALPIDVGYRYVFKDFVVEAPYAHTPLTESVFYPAGHVVGDQVKVTAGGFGNPSWHRELDWSAGLPLDGLIPFAGLVVPDAQRRAYTTTAVSGKFHVRIRLDGPEETQDKFWNYVEQGAARSGIYLYDILGFSGAGEKSVNPLETFFSVGLCRNALVVDLRNLPSAGHAARAKYFIDNEKPVGSAVITRTFND